VTPADEKLLKGSKIKFIGTATIGTDHVDENYLKQNRIAFASASGSNANSVAEYIACALLSIACRKGFELKRVKPLELSGSAMSAGRLSGMLKRLD